MMRNLLFLIFILNLAACSKSGDAPTPAPPVVVKEPNLSDANVVTVDIDPGPNVVYAVVGTSQKIDVKLTAIPAAGVTIDTKLTKLQDNTIPFTNSITTSNLTNSVIVTGLTPGTVYMLTVVVTSKNTASNSKTIEFKMAAK